MVKSRKLKITREKVFLCTARARKILLRSFFRLPIKAMRVHIAPVPREEITYRNCLRIASARNN